MCSSKIFPALHTFQDKGVFSQLIMDRHLLFTCVFPVFWQFEPATELQVLDNKGSWCRRSYSLDKRLREKFKLPVKGCIDRCYLSSAQRRTVLWRMTSLTIMQNKHPSNTRACGRATQTAWGNVSLHVTAGKFVFCLLMLKGPHLVCRRLSVTSSEREDFCW